MNNIYVLNKSYRQIGVLSNQGANPQAPYYDDLYVQELDTGADTFQFSAVSNKYTQDLLEIGNHIMFSYKNRNELFTITSLEYSHYEGYKTIGVYAEGIGFELLDVFMERPPIKSYPSNDNNNGSNSGGSSSGGNSGGNDSDGDGDDNTDDEYADPDDVYIDENGNIIYDKDGSGPPKKEDVTIDGDGNIIYKPNKRNEKNDSLEFKNISYSRFLSILLKNTGWSYTCQPGLDSVKHNISVRYDTNIYAILQDSMQAYRGVELEFVYEMHGGKVQKTIKAYKDGGRGSFVGKRFEYGTNVRGITKTQEVTNSEDDTVLYVDNIGVEVYYDVDFALKSAEVSEIEIGDTHYVIDREFCPPMTIKARIGKIEISFSDPTKNKISLANNKKIRGSAIEDELDEDDIKDIIDDYDPIIDDGIVDDGTGDDGTGDDDGPDTYIPGIDVEELSTIELHSALLTVPLEENKTGELGLVDDSNTSLYPNLGFGKKQVLDFLMNDIEVCRYTHMDVVGKYWRAGIKDFPAYLDIVPNVEFSNNPLYFHRDHNSEGYDRWSDCEWKSDVASAIVIKDTEDINGDGDEIDEGEHTTHSYNLPSLVAAVIAAFQYHIDYHPSSDTGGEIPDLSDYATKTYVEVYYASKAYVDNAIAALEIPDSSAGYATEGYVDQKVNYMENYVNNSHNNLNDLIVSETKKIDDKLEEHIKNCTSNDNSNNGDNGNSDSGSSLGIPDGVIEYSFNEELNRHRLTVKGDMEVDNLDINNWLSVNKFVTNTIDAGDIFIQSITFSDGTKMTTAGGGSNNSIFRTIYVDRIYCNRDTNAEPGVPEAEISFKDYGKYLDLIACHQIRSYCNVFSISGDLKVHTISGGGGAVPLKYIKVDSDIKMPNYCIECKELTQSSDKSLKENIRYIDEPVKRTNDDLLDKADLHDFIVNQVSICEYNFIGDTSDKIGFIANDYEGTKVGDKIVSRNEENNTLTYSPDNLLFATIGALQEEVRIRDEQIASLEARLAAIEEMLNNK